MVELTCVITTQSPAMERRKIARNGKHVLSAILAVAWMGCDVGGLDEPPALSPDSLTSGITFAATADAVVQQASPSTNSGTGTSLRVDASPSVDTYLKFDVSGISGTITKAVVQLYVTNGSTDGPAVIAAGNSWTETGLTWNNQPAPIGSVLDNKGSIAASTWVEFNVTAAVTGNGTYSFKLYGPGTDGTLFNSREASSNPPHLVVVAASPLPSNTALPTIAGTAQQGETLTSTNGTWTGSPTSYAHQWQDCDSTGVHCANIAGATASSYVLTSADVAHTIRITVTATNPSGSASATSAQTALVTAGTPPTPDLLGGVQLFPPTDYVNLKIDTAPIDPNSAAMIAAAQSIDGNLTLTAPGGRAQPFNIVPGNQATGSISARGTSHTFPQHWPLGGTPVANPLSISTGGDGVLLVIQKAGSTANGWSGNPASLWHAGYVQYSGGNSYTAYGGAGWPLDRPMTPYPPNDPAPGGGTGVSTTGLPVRMFLPWGENFGSGSSVVPCTSPACLIAGNVIPHVLDGEFPFKSPANNGYLYPCAASADTPGFPGCAKLRLRADFPETGLNADALTIVHTLKVYGIAVVDNGCCFGIYLGNDVPADATAWGTIHLSDFDVIKLGPTNGSPYTYPGHNP